MESPLGLERLRTNMEANRAFGEETIIPTVHATQEFLEIARDFANPLDIVREAISNSYDAKAKQIDIRFDVIHKYDEPVLRIVLEDDGEGMGRAGLQAFFDLGNSTRRHLKCEDPTLIGEKGHGTKIFFNSEQVSVTTTDGPLVFNATMQKPFVELFEGRIPTVSLSRTANTSGFKGTRIEILGYNRNRRDMFTHGQLKDHILWFTKHGSIEKQFRQLNDPVPVIRLSGIDYDDPESEIISFGHVFPEESVSVDSLYKQHHGDAPHFFVKKWVVQGSLPDYPEIKYEMVFAVEGDRVKRASNPMLRRRGQTPKPGSYQVQERYGLWLAKDYIPIQRRNEWVTSRGSEFTKFHAFLNCQALRLTANRGSIENTPAETIDALGKVARELYNSIVESEEWSKMEWLEERASAYNTEKKEQLDYERRVKLAKSQKLATYNGVKLSEPRYENGVYSLFVILQTLEPHLFPFEIIDYDTHSGIDVIAKTRDDVDVGQSSLRYVEFKHTLSSTFNHSFKNLHSIVCWKTKIEHEGQIEDVASTERTMVVTPPVSDGQYTRYMLDDSRSTHKIEVFVLETYIKEKLGITF